MRVEGLDGEVKEFALYFHHNNEKYAGAYLFKDAESPWNNLNITFDSLDEIKEFCEAIAKMGERLGEFD